jgi:DNA-directed RNA polymerase subunit RPC12/RpoP
MNVRELVFRDSTETALYACGECGKIYSPAIYMAPADRAHKAAREMAENCCKPKACEDCGAELAHNYYMTVCRSCSERRQVRRATAIPDYYGWIQQDGPHGPYGDGYWPDLDEYLQACEDSEVEPEPYVWCCTATRFKLDAGQILEAALEEHYEDAYEDVIDGEELEEFIKRWNAKQTLVTYYVDHTRLVVIDQARFDAYLAGGNAPQ